MNDCEMYIVSYFKDLYENKKNTYVETMDFLEHTENIKKNLELYPGSKKIIKYKEPPKKKNTVKNPDIPDIPAFARYTLMDSLSSLVLFGDPSNVYFSFTRPIFELGLTGELQRNYKNIRKGDSLYIWQNLDKTGPMHLTAHIVTSDGTHYSLGFGFSGKKKFDTNIPLFKEYLDENIGEAAGVIYTPDKVFEHKMLDQCKKPGNYVKLISATSITDEHLKNMNDAFDMLSEIKSATLFFTPIRTSPSYQKKVIRENLIVKLKQMLLFSMFDKVYNADIEKYIAYLENEENRDFESIYTINYSLDYPVNYCRVSGARHRGKHHNCASFLHQVFSDSIDCGIMSNFVISPAKCESGSLPLKKCRPLRPR